MADFIPSILTTERLVLRPLELTDAPRIFTLASAYEIAVGTLNTPHPYPEGAATDFVRAAQSIRDNGSGYVFAIAPRDETGIAGVVGIHPTPAHQRAELGYWMGVPYWGRGYMTEAVRRVIQFGFDDLSLNKIQAAVFAGNTASLRVAEKVGMTYEGTLRQHFRRFDAYKDTLYFSILREEWRAPD